MSAKKYKKADRGLSNLGRQLSPRAAGRRIQDGVDLKGGASRRAVLPALINWLLMPKVSACCSAFRSELPFRSDSELD